MKTVKVVAAIIIHENKIFATLSGDTVSSRTAGNSRAGRSSRGRHRRRRLVREIKEELDIEIEVKDFLETVEYDYPDFPSVHGLLLLLDQVGRTGTEGA